jgi:hypothetical protein
MAAERLEQLTHDFRAEVIREVKKRIYAELKGDEDGRWTGPLGERIAASSGNYSPEFTAPQQVAYGLGHWLDCLITEYEKELPQ